MNRTRSVSLALERTLNRLILPAGLFLFAMMVVTVIDVVARRLIGRSIPGAIDLVSVGFALSLSLALPVITWRETHFVLELFSSNPTGPLGRLRRHFVAGISAVIIGIAGWCLLQYALDAWYYQDVMGYLQIPVAPLALIISFSLFLSAAIFAIQTFGLTRPIVPTTSEAEDTP
ncbi:TRAP transporter small permease subunit [Martelella mediterranea]|uniref:TRAP transporter small permease n=1 Tax=Martelella mediterranea TaxID=293089 RepID=UPI001E475685|nr:TRAP transporter small permease [Martelella mediterranea]MCD1636538.1 TRAP transporter small permease subunit [Martelella mediterranea]